MAIIEFDTKNFSVLKSQRNASLRTAILVHFLQDETGLTRGQFLNDEDYIFALNKKYNRITIDIAPYHYFISVNDDEVTVRQNKNINHRLNFSDHRKTYEHDVSIMICTDKYSDLSKVAVEKISLFLGYISVQNNIILEEIVLMDSVKNDISEMKEKAILFRNKIAPVFNIVESVLYKAESEETFPYSNSDSGDESFPYEYVSASFNPHKSRYIVKGDKEILFPGVDFKILYTPENSICKILLQNQVSELSVSLIKNPMTAVSNEAVRLINGVDSERYRKMIMDKYSITEDLFKKMNAHIYEDHCDNYINREYLVVPTAVCETDYKSLNQLKKAEMDFSAISKFRT